MRTVKIGDIVHFYDRAAEPWEPNKIGPYAAIVTFVRVDGNIDCEVFPTRDSVPGGMAHNIPPGDRQTTKGDGILLRRWWQWPDEAKVDKG